MTTRIIDLLIPAAVGANPGVYVERVAGKIVTCVSATAAFSVTKDNGTKIPLNTGQDTGDINATEFGSLVFYNTTGAVITARVAVGYVQYTPDKAVTANITATVTTTGKNADTYSKATPIAGLTIFNGLDGGNKRKLITVQNTGATAVDIKVGAVTAISIPAGQTNPIALETNAAFEVQPNGGTANILEIFYSP